MANLQCQVQLLQVTNKTMSIILWTLLPWYHHTMRSLSLHPSNVSVLKQPPEGQRLFGRIFGRRFGGRGQCSDARGGVAGEREPLKPVEFLTSSSSSSSSSLSSSSARLLREASGACGESEVRRGLSGTKLQIHMICLAKRVKEKWIKAWRDQRSATMESRRLPWDQQEMHIIYKLFYRLLSDVAGNWLLLFGGRAPAGRGLGGVGGGRGEGCTGLRAGVSVSQRAGVCCRSCFKLQTPVMRVREATAAAPSTSR